MEISRNSGKFEGERRRRLRGRRHRKRVAGTRLWAINHHQNLAPVGLFHVIYSKAGKQEIQAK